MRSFFFRNNGIVLDGSVCSCERTIVPQERRPALMTCLLSGLKLNRANIPRQFLNIVYRANDAFNQIKWGMNIENRIYREELNESLGMNFFSPFQPEREFKVYKSCKCFHKLYAVHHTNTVWSLDMSIPISLF